MSGVATLDSAPHERLKMGRNYTEAEIAVLDENLDRINEMWNKFVLTRLNGREGDVHNPPALNRAVVDLLNHILSKMADEGEPIVGIEIFAGFAANMFAFGQWAAERGLRMSDLFECKCTEITDEDIQNLLGK